MEPNYSKIFNEKIIQTVSAFCSENEIKDVDGFIFKCFKQGFDIKKYGLLGKTLNEDEKDLKTGIVEEKQLIKEVIVEVPIEVIKEVEKIVEVIKEIPVETIKEVVIEKPIDRIVEKEIYITDDNQVNELGVKITKLEENILHLESQLDEERKIFSTKTEEMENFFQKEIAKKDKELDEVRQSLDIKLDETNEKMLQETLQKLRKELTEKNEKIKELTKINQDLQNTRENKLSAIFLRGSNLNDTV